MKFRAEQRTFNAALTTSDTLRAKLAEHTHCVDRNDAVIVKVAP